MKCRLCQKTIFRTIFKRNDYDVVQCTACGFGSLKPLPSDETLERIYNDEHYHEDKSETEHHHDAQIKLNYIKRWVTPHNRLLDYGCGNGTFLQKAKKAGFRAEGYDWAEASARQANKNSDCQVKCGEPRLDLFETDYFDALTVFDVIEHIIDWQPIVMMWKRWLKPGGRLFITTPDLSSWDYRLLTQHWYGFTKIPQHVNYFDRRSLANSLRLSGFRVAEMQTWGFSRSLTFLVGKIPGGSLLDPVLHGLSLDQKTLYLPMIDMMAVAVKV